MRAGERGAAGVAAGDALEGLGCLGAFSFFWVGAGGGVVMVALVGSDGAEVLVLACTLCSMVALRACAAVSLLGSSAGFVRPTTRGLSCPPDVVRGSGFVDGAMLGCVLWEELVAGAWRWRAVMAL